jgi:hypothetical protein
VTSQGYSPPYNLTRSFVPTENKDPACFGRRRFPHVSSLSFWPPLSNIPSDRGYFSVQSDFIGNGWRYSHSMTSSLDHCPLSTFHTLEDDSIALSRLSLTDSTRLGRNPNGKQQISLSRPWLSTRPHFFIPPTTYMTRRNRHSVSTGL